MRTQTRETYICDHCNKLYLRKHACLKHEDLCFRNPESKRRCFDCTSLRRRATDISYDTPIGEQYRTVELFYCKAKEIYLYTPQNEKKGNQFDLGDYLNEPMPTECGKWSDIYGTDSLDGLFN